MPFFTETRHVEAYQLPKEGQQPSDGLIFFLRSIHLDGILDKLGAPGSWVISTDEGVRVLSDKAFKARYKPAS